MARVFRYSKRVALAHNSKEHALVDRYPVWYAKLGWPRRHRRPPVVAHYCLQNVAAGPVDNPADA